VIVAQLSVAAAATMYTRSSAVAKRPCDCCVGQFLPKYNWKTIFCTEHFIGLSLTTVT